MTKFEAKNESTFPNGVKSSSTLTFEGLSPEELMVVLDKPFNEFNETVRDDAVEIQRKPFTLYAEALRRGMSTGQAREASGESTGDENEFTGDEGEATALDLNNFDANNPGDLLALLRDVTENAKTQVQIGKAADGKPAFQFRFEIAGRTFEFSASDLQSLRSSGTIDADLDNLRNKLDALLQDLSSLGATPAAVADLRNRLNTLLQGLGSVGGTATGLDSDSVEPNGGEVIEDNQVSRAKCNLKWNAWATADGETQSQNNDIRIGPTVISAVGLVVVQNVTDTDLVIGLNVLPVFDVANTTISGAPTPGPLPTPTPGPGVP